jgi:hypothetical protein
VKVRELAAGKFGESPSGLVAVSARWFHPNDPCYKDRDGSVTANADIHPEKFLAKGTGKGAAGYALPNKVTPAMVKKQLEWRLNTEQGTHKAHTDYRELCAKQGVLRLIECGGEQPRAIEDKKDEAA